MVLDSWLKKIKDRIRRKEPESQEVPSNWVPELIKKKSAELQEDGTVKVIYEEKGANRYIARRIKRFLCMILIMVNFIMLVTCFFVEGGIMSPFFFCNTIFLMDYFWRTRPLPLEAYR